MTITVPSKDLAPSGFHCDHLPAHCEDLSRACSWAGVRCLPWEDAHGRPLHSNRPFQHPAQCMRQAMECPLLQRMLRPAGGPPLPCLLPAPCGIQRHACSLEVLHCYWKTAESGGMLVMKRDVQPALLRWLITRRKEFVTEGRWNKKLHLGRTARTSRKEVQNGVTRGGVIAELPPDLCNRGRHAQVQILQLPRIPAAGLATSRVCPCGEGPVAGFRAQWPQQGPCARRRGSWRRCCRGAAGWLVGGLLTLGRPVPLMLLLQLCQPALQCSSHPYTVDSARHACLPGSV